MNIKETISKIPGIPWKYLVPAYSVIAFVVMTVIHLSNSGAASAFFENGGFIKLLLNLIFVLLINVLVFASSARSAVSGTVTLVLSTLFAVSVNTTYVITGKPLQPSDFLLADELGSIVSFVDIRLGAWVIIMITVAFLAIVAGFVISGVKKENISKKIRIYAASASAVLLIVFIWLFGFSEGFISVCLPKMGISVSADSGADYLHSGAVLCFLPKMTYLSSPDSDGYTAEDIEKIKNNYTDNVSFEKTGDVRPSIITIQNEAWWDPTLLPDVYFDRDPMPTYRSGMENLKAGFMVTPVFGGGTCIPEFEYLTAFSSVYLPPNCYPYIQAVNSKTPSVASALRDGGYETTAIHTYKTNFYGRKKAFPLMGFDRFLGADDMENPEISGFYVSDEEMGRQIISAYENKKSDNVFIFGLTMQNHGDYTKPRYAWHEVGVSSNSLSEDDRRGLADFTQGVYDADRLFLNLTEYFSKTDEPVLIIMYGDHLPLLGTEGSTYTGGGLVPEDVEFNFADHEVLQKTPFVIWANYSLEQYNLPEEISPVGLSLFTLKAANLDSVPWHFKVADDFNREYPIFTPQLIKNKAGEKVSSVSEKDLEYNYMLVQHDILYGKKYSLK